ncbi:unnamed protein product, partial [Staurois parvus]
GERPVSFTHRSLPCQCVIRRLPGAAHCSHPDQCAYSEEHPPPPRPLVKHSQHTVNPLITPHMNPFLPNAIITVSVLFV